MKKLKRPPRQKQIRMGEELEAQIHEYRKLLTDETGIEATFSDATRALIRKGLKTSGVKAFR
jgi:hypothetical protein